MTTPTHDDDLPILTRRRIEAAILAPVYRILVRDLGEERAKEILSEAIREDARAQGARLAQREPGGSNLRTFIDLQHLWLADDAQEIETIEATDEVYSYDVHRCRYAETYQEMGLGDIGELLSCTRDFEFPHGYDPSITLERTQTIMSGASHCDFRYRRPAGAPNAHAVSGAHDSAEVAHVAAEERDR
ncbi:L-2-amino-thiazoline-4-carboxylic acid hydrolase [Georgenia sp. Z1344]|uniref:L-2-amino-thiazoline-4-carboxylic acid hydrolase n=1 Tax=Georgenia sp. Z1344 TaxID=3416706 RepID=UPI003CEA1F21